MFEKHGIETAQQILGDAVWARILKDRDEGPSSRVFFEAEGTNYLVTHSLSNCGTDVNVYMTRLQ